MAANDIMIRYPWNGILYGIMIISILIFVLDNIGYIFDGSWIKDPEATSFTVFKWVAISVICFILLYCLSI